MKLPYKIIIDNEVVSEYDMPKKAELTISNPENKDLVGQVFCLDRVMENKFLVVSQEKLSDGLFKLKIVSQ